MRRNNKTRLIPLALALVLVLLGVALAVPTISVTVKELGQGSEVITSTVSSATVDWNLNSNNPDYVVSATVTISADPGAGTLYVKLYDSGGNLVAYGQVTLDGSGSYTVTFTNGPGVTADGVALSSFSQVYVVYKGA